MGTSNLGGQVRESIAFFLNVKVVNMDISSKYFYVLAYQRIVQLLYQMLDILTWTALSKHEKQGHGWRISRWWLLDKQRFKTLYLKTLVEINLNCQKLSSETIWQILSKDSYSTP